MDPPRDVESPEPREGRTPAGPEPTLEPVPAATFAFAAAAVALFSGGLFLAGGALASVWPWPALATALVVAALVLWRLHGEGVLRDLMRYRPGDVIRGGAAGALVFALCALVANGIVPNVPALARDLATVAPALDGVGRNVAFLAALAICAAEELMMRGLVQRATASRAGVARAVVIAATVQALVWLPSGHPTLVLLGLLAGVGAGVVQARSQRLVPSLFAHLMVVFLLSTFPLHGPR